MQHIIAKRVTTLELFYDLVFVYAIARISHMLQHLHNGQIDWLTYLQFVGVCIIIMQIWLYQTVYINKYGNQTMSDTLGLFISMFGAVYVSNSINTEWHLTFYSFNSFAVLMIASVAFQYYRAYKRQIAEPKEFKAFFGILLFEIAVILCGLLFGYTIGIWIVLVGYAIATFFPAFFQRNYSPKTMNFPHLVERLGLITIIIFGEFIVTITQFFDVNQLSLIPLTIFSAVVCLFLSYIIQTEKLMEHHQHSNGFVLMYSHVFILIGLETMMNAVAYGLNTDVNSQFMVQFLIVGLGCFYLALISLSHYNQAQYRLTPRWIGYYLCVYLLGSLGLFLCQTQLPLLYACLLVMNGSFLFLLWQFSKQSN